MIRRVAEKMICYQSDEKLGMSISSKEKNDASTGSSKICVLSSNDGNDKVLSNKNKEEKE